MQDCIFRQYDIRGKVGIELPLEHVYDLAKAIAYYFVQKNPQVKTVAVGADGRVHSPEIKEKVCQALQDSGLNVIFIGTCPTPVLYFSLFTIPEVDAGLMITASHNGKEYNGIKICLNKESVWGHQIQEIKELYKSGACLPANNKGTYREMPVIQSYIQWLYEHFQSLVGMEYKAVIDCGNGAAGTVLPGLIKKMEWHNVQLLYPEVDGSYPNHEADPIIEENMQEVKRVLQTTDAHIGMGLDGDCDRMTPMTKSGELVSGDKLLALFAQPILKEHPHAAIIFDIKCSAGLISLLEQWNAKPIISPSGHSIIKDQMKRNNGLLAGELSCHFFFHDRYFGYDDGIYALMRLFDILQNTGKNLDELLTVFPQSFSTPEIRIECPEEGKVAIVEEAKNKLSVLPNAKVLTIDGIRVMTDYGWGILRASNTQPVLCLRFESSSKEGLKRIKMDFIEALVPYINEGLLEKQVGV